MMSCLVRRKFDVKLFEISMFQRSGFAVNYITNLLRTQYKGLIRYSGEYNVLILALMTIYFDHYLEKRI